MAHPRKFVEKIAIHNAKMAEETRAFEEIMKEVSDLGNSMKAPPSQHQQYRSLPNVNIGFGQNHIDLQKALMNLDNMQRPGLVDRLPMRERRYTANRTTPFPKRNFGIDTSPYHAAPPYLSPPQMDQGQNWRRAISDSSLHQTVMGGQIKDMDMNKINDFKRAGSPQSRPRSCEVPGINSSRMYQTEQVSPVSTPQMANTGSLPDLTNLHIPSPLPTPIDVDDNQMNQAASPPHYQTSPRHVRRHTHSPVVDKQPFPPQMPYMDPNMSPLELRLQQFQPYQQSPTSTSDASNQFVSHNTTVSSPIMSPTASTSMSPLLKNLPNPPLSPLASDFSFKQQQINNSLQQQMQQDPFGMNLAYIGGGLQQRMQFQSMPQQGMQSPNNFGQPGNRLPDLIITSEDEESQRLDFARELSSAMANVGGGNPSDLYSEELGQLDMESLQMLSGHGDSEVADQATEDQFRMDRLAGFSRSILCRRVCDRCNKVIRFFGFRCKDCRFKCHRKCSNCITTKCRQTRDFRPNHMTCVGKFWQKPSKRRKWPLTSNFDSLPSRRPNVPEDLQRSLQPRKYIDAKGKIRQKLINGLYDSFCYSPRHDIDPQPSSSSKASSTPQQTTNVTIHREQILRDIKSSFRGERLEFGDVDLVNASENTRRTSQEQYLPCPQTWKRTYSWSSRHSAMTSFTSSSGYSSMPASCPSSANSHRSSSPTPDFSNIRSLTATLERCSLEEDMDQLQDREEFRESFAERSLPMYVLTWPMARKTRPNQNDTRRIFSVDDCQTTSEREDSVKSSTRCSQSDQDSEDDIKKSLKEWKIPFKDLQFGDEVGASPKGHVFKGRWHGDIMIHTVKKTAKQDLEEFLKEVSLLSMIRHENVVLFMGACLEPPNLAFITSVRKGLSLHTHLHVRHDFFPLSTRISIARQIAQGMSYLHAKGIVLPHFNSMNVFLESKVKLCVTAYSGRTVVERNGYVSIPRGHMTYIPPEMMRTLVWCDDEILPFTKHSVQSNLYAYGTLLYEIMTGRWPFSTHPVDSVIWLVGKGTKQCLRHTKCPENIKTLLRECWSFEKEDRPEFSKIVQFFQEQNVCNFPPESTHKRINGSYSEPEKMHLVGRTSGRLSIR
ncbi:uncharacterized protein LOC116297441 [Actinia tenebrosa]|uniref:Uncharacterized protein LOC116297441 n=1 Tax=Actinia tenebrosa TaxID=6105 RepID=A0A6P8HYR4_ACTTE|nr:uncharacterized protein LOC116297441 [Actinia tenebrosa]